MPESPSWVESLPLVGAKIGTRWRGFGALTPDERWAELAPYLQSALQWFVSKAGGVGGMLVQFLLTTVITAILLANGESVRDGLLRFAQRLAGEQGREAAVLAGSAIRAVVLGVVGTALIQVAIGGASLYLLGVPAAGLLSAVMLFFCLAQLGPAAGAVAGGRVAVLVGSDQWGRDAARAFILPGRSTTSSGRS